MPATALAVADVAVAGLAQDAAAGDERAWRDLVARFEPLLRGIARGYRLDPADVEDVVQVTWFRAFRSLDRLNEPAAVGAWLATTARREAMRTLQRGVRELPADDPHTFEEPDAETPEAATLELERLRALRAAVRRLPGRQGELLGAMLKRPGASYGELSSELDMPLGSIGPTRERALGTLRKDPALAEVLS